MMSIFKFITFLYVCECSCHNMHATQRTRFGSVAFWVIKPSLAGSAASTSSHWASSSADQWDYELLWKQTSEGTNEDPSLLERFNWMGKNYDECMGFEKLNKRRKSVEHQPYLSLFWLKCNATSYLGCPLLWLIYHDGHVMPQSKSFCELLLSDFCFSTTEREVYGFL